MCEVHVWWMGLFNFMEVFVPSFIETFQWLDIWSLKLNYAYKSFFFNNLQSFSSALTDDEAPDACNKNGFEKTIRAVYSQKKVWPTLLDWQWEKFHAFIYYLHIFSCTFRLNILLGMEREMGCMKQWEKKFGMPLKRSSCSLNKWVMWFVCMILLFHIRFYNFFK